MGRTRFMVVKAKELIKTAVFAVLGVIILVGLIAFFLNMGKHDGAGKTPTQERDGAADARKAEFSGERRTGAKRHARVSDVCDGGFGGRLSADFFI